MNRVETLDPKALKAALDVFEIETKINSKSPKHGLSEAIAAYLSTPIAAGSGEATEDEDAVTASERLALQAYADAAGRNASLVGLRAALSPGRIGEETEESLAVLATCKAGVPNPTAQRALEDLCERLIASLSRKTAGEAVPVAYAYVVDGECEEIGWGKPPLEDLSLVLLFRENPSGKPANR